MFCMAIFDCDIVKHGASVTEIKTSPDGSIQDNIGLLYGTAVQK